MAGRDVKALERQFAKLTHGLRSEIEGTASAPLSYSATCYPEIGIRACVSNPITGRGGFFVCPSDPNYPNDLESKLEDRVIKLQSKGRGTAAYNVLVQGVDELRKELARQF